VESSFRFRNVVHDVYRTPTPPISSATVIRLLGQTVASATAEKNGTLTLTFGNGETLQMLDSGAPWYEWYHIRFGDQHTIV